MKPPFSSIVSKPKEVRIFAIDDTIGCIKIIEDFFRKYTDYRVHYFNVTEKCFKHLSTFIPHIVVLNPHIKTNVFLQLKNAISKTIDTIKFKNRNHFNNRPYKNYVYTGSTNIIRHTCNFCFVEVYIFSVIHNNSPLKLSHENTTYILEACE